MILCQLWSMVCTFRLGIGFEAFVAATPCNIMTRLAAGKVASSDSLAFFGALTGILEAFTVLGILRHMAWCA